MEQMIARFVADFERGKITRRQLVRLLTAAAGAATAGASSAAAASGGLKAVSINHISYQVADYARTRDFYAELLGMKVANDTGRQANLLFGSDGAYLLPRNTREPGTAPRIDHIAYTIEHWDKDAVRDELERRGLKPRPDTDLSFHVEDPDGYDVQIAGRA